MPVPSSFLATFLLGKQKKSSRTIPPAFKFGARFACYILGPPARLAKK
jgi:hypothetical protein